MPAVLNRTLGSLIALSVALAVTGCNKEPATTTAAAPAAPTAGMPAAEPHPTPAAPAEAVDVSGIAKADGGKTIAEVFAEKDQLAGQPVVFRGKVVKTNPNIMGKNWLHVRDGSGAEGTNDLTVTTAGTAPNIGDTVVVKGTVVLNKDFGMGYQYDVIVEDAEVTVEATGS
jgi:hypothetical protein